MTLLLYAVPVGIGATLLLDLWSWSLGRFGVRSMDWCLAGRWLGHLPRGRFMHESIAKAAPVTGECRLGWTLHYATGVVFAVLLLAVAGSGWLRQPTLLPALLVGVSTIVFPFFVMQPGMGAGVAASRTPSPTRARLRSLLTHAVFGLGLYAAAWMVAVVVRA